MRIIARAAGLSFVLWLLVWAQQPQNPSPMVEHTRTHPRLAEQTPPGRRESLELGTLFVPQDLTQKRTAPLLVFFHGGTWVPEVAAARNRMAAISIRVGAGSAVYVRAFTDPQRFENLLREAEQKAGMRFAPLTLGGWSAGCGAIREILKSPTAYERVERVLAIDGIHTDYAEGHPGPLDSKLAPENLELWLRLARDAVAGRKRLIVTHSEIFPGTYASTTETADYLLAQLGVRRQPVVRWGPMGTQELSRASAGRLLLIGFAGNAAPDHVDQLHSLPEYLKWK
jgi:hypothetical protein